MRPSQIESLERRRRNWRLILVTIIMITIPFYCVGIFLWGTAPPRNQIVPTATVNPLVSPSPTIVTSTPDGFIPSITPLPITVDDFTPLPTFGPPPSLTPTRFLSPTPTFIVVPTDPPPPPPTDIPPPTAPLITDTPLPF